MQENNFICTACPMGCKLIVRMQDGEVVKVVGNRCRRGETYGRQEAIAPQRMVASTCLLYTSDAADELLCVDLGGTRIIKKKTTKTKNYQKISQTSTQDRVKTAYSRQTTQVIYG